MRKAFNASDFSSLGSFSSRRAAFRAVAKTKKESRIGMQALGRPSRRGKGAGNRRLSTDVTASVKIIQRRKVSRTKRGQKIPFSPDCNAATSRRALSEAGNGGIIVADAPPPSSPPPSPPSTYITLTPERVWVATPAGRRALGDGSSRTRDARSLATTQTQGTAGTIETRCRYGDHNALYTIEQMNELFASDLPANSEWVCEVVGDIDCPDDFYQLGEDQCEAYAAMQGAAYSDRLGPSDLMQGCILMNDVLTGTVPTYYHISGIYPNNGSSPDNPIGCAVGVTCVCVYDPYRYPVSPPSAPAPPLFPSPPQKPSPVPPPPAPP